MVGKVAINGLNRPDGETQIIPCASCTTNNITPLVEILDRHFGVESRASWRMPDTYHTAGIRRDRHRNFYGNRDNL
jgi:glyceraldehyde-3-phosphate dehydrogenase/erythrose-4-phosphate dehydrogenase